MILATYCMQYMYLLECLANNGDCAFYEEVQSVMQCSPGGYPIDFGLRYCRRFKEAEGAFSKEVINLEKSVKGLAMYDLNIQNSFQGRKWVGDVRKCLMRKLLPVFCPERHDKFKTWYEEVMKAKSSLSDITPFFLPPLHALQRCIREDGLPLALEMLLLGRQAMPGDARGE